MFSYPHFGGIQIFGLDTDLSAWFHSVPPQKCRTFLYSTPVHSTPVESGLQSALNRCTVQPFTESDDNRCCVNTISPPEDGHVNARNMSRIIV